MKTKKIILMVILSLLLSSKLMAATVMLSSKGLGTHAGDQGTGLVSGGLFLMSAQTTDVKTGHQSQANVWLDSKYGAGVVSGYPSKHGKHELDASKYLREELIFSFDAPVAAGSIFMGLAKYDGKHDGTTLRLVDAYDGSETLLSDSDWLGAATFVDKHSAIIDLSKLSAVGNATLTSIAVSQTAGSVYVSSIDFASTSGDTAPVPEPTTLAMLSLGCLVFIRKRKA